MTLSSAKNNGLGAASQANVSRGGTPQQMVSEAPVAMPIV
jgi:hypothetical protein